MAEPSSPGQGLRLAVYLAHSGLTSRRKAEELIRSGRVRANGRIVKLPGFRVGEEVITCDGRRIYPIRRRVYLALHKPPGYLCALSDERGRPLAGELLKKAYGGRLYPVGRLDFLSSGLIFYTNDGDFTRRVSHPSGEVEKEYLVETKGAVPEDFLRRCLGGLFVEGVFYKIEKYRYNKPDKVYLTLKEGKNREIRRLFASRRIAVKRLHRVRIGEINLQGLPPGGYRVLEPPEVAGLLGGGRPFHREEP
ncbi:MAG: rRNA pseudouridine synthase [Spirochaetales bacterium]|jgi:23S rRNA pseudouridine2605 synthase|nr:rRNA pseudouridine synthase [Spirochaetales bacterium]